MAESNGGGGGVGGCARGGNRSSSSSAAALTSACSDLWSSLPTSASTSASAAYSSSSSSTPLAGKLGGGNDRDLLSALRSFRSTVMHLAKKAEGSAKKDGAASIEERATKKSQEDSIDDGRAAAEDDTNPAGLPEKTYRLLLRLSVSSSPLSSRTSSSQAATRAARSAADALRLLLLAENDDDGGDGGGDRGEFVEEAHVACVEYVLALGSAAAVAAEEEATNNKKGGDGTTGGGDEGGRSADEKDEDDPIGTLFELLSYGPLSSVVLNSSFRVSKALKLILAATEKDRSVLEEHSYLSRRPSTAMSEKEEKGSDVDGVGGGSGGGFPPSLLSAVERGVDAATAIKLILTPLLVRADDDSSDKGGGGRILETETEKSEEAAAATTSTIPTLLEDVANSLLLPLLSCPASSGDGLSVAGVAYGQCRTLLWKARIADAKDNETDAGAAAGIEEAAVADDAAATISSRAVAEAARTELDSVTNDDGRSDQTVGGEAFRGRLPTLNRLALVKGLAASLPESALFGRFDMESGRSSSSSSPSPLSLLSSPIGSYLLLQSRTASDPAVRLSALRGLDVLLGRAGRYLLVSRQSQSAGLGSEGFGEEVRALTDEALEVALSTWESPPSRQVGSAVPGLFSSLVKLTTTLDGSGDGGNRSNERNDSSVDALVQRVLSQPPRRKGRYVALEALLPVVGAGRLLELSSDGGTAAGNREGGDLIASLVAAVGDRGSNNANAVAALLGKVLGRLRVEMLAEAGMGDDDDGEDGEEEGTGNKKKRRKEKEAKKRMRRMQRQKQRRAQEGSTGGSSGGRDGATAAPPATPAATATVVEEGGAAAAAAPTPSGQERPEERRRLTNNGRRKKSRLPPGWSDLFVPHFARAISSYSYSSSLNDDASFDSASSRRLRRTQSADFLLPLIADAAGGPSRRHDAGLVFAELLREIGGGERADKATERGDDAAAAAAAAAWAKLEAARHALAQKLLGPPSSVASQLFSAELMEAVASELPPPLLRLCLLHESSRVRSSAFASIEAVVPCYYYCRRSSSSSDVSGSDAPPAAPMPGDADPSSSSSSSPERAVLECALLESDLWTECLPYAIKCGDREYANRLNGALGGLLRRMSDAVAEVREAEEGAEEGKDRGEATEEAGDESAGRGNGEEEPKEEEKDAVSSFACDVVIETVALRMGCYPGTVADKEAFALPLLRTILDFACEGAERPNASASSSTDEKKKKRPRHRRMGKSGVPRRKLLPSQLRARRTVLRRLLSPDAFGTFLGSLLHSPWDKTRADAYDLAIDVVRRGRARAVPLPPCLVDEDQVRNVRRRAVHLAGSPRQRESDTGARLLGVLHASRGTEEEREEFATEAVRMAEDRLGRMRRSLLEGGGRTSSDDDARDGDASSSASSSSFFGGDLPLAHGLFRALRLIMADGGGCGGSSGDLRRRAADACCRAIELSLTVVADVARDDDDDKEEEEGDGGAGDGAAMAATPLNVNTGAIGANACYSGVTSANERDDGRRFAAQRVVVGSWLLTKEACATLATTISHFPGGGGGPSPSLVDEAGTLLLRTLTSLKHQGAAFAAHRALQQISAVCGGAGDGGARDGPEEENEDGNGGRNLRTLPWKWARSLLRDISSPETVRDSTLRRSTGYALGFLSILRTEPSTGGHPRTLCPFVLASIVRLSLPPVSAVESKLLSLNDSRWVDRGGNMFVYPRHLPASQPLFPVDESYEWRSRVHALNVLRLAILDAPLASEVNKFVGDAVVSAMLGYDDESWAVRNSATMVLASALLRVVDADKNAASQSASKAITARELFRTYPSLSTFWLATMKECLSKASLRDSLYTPIFPILLLLARLEPVSFSGSGSREATEPFVGPVLSCLGHRQHKVRVMASRALAVLCSGDDDVLDGTSSRPHLIGRCLDLLGWEGDNFREGRQKVSSDWNRKHGALLGIQSLLRCLPGAKERFSDDRRLSSAIFWYASWDSGGWTCPPACVAVALQTWALVWRTYKEEEICVSSGATYEDVVYNTVGAMEDLAQRNALSNMVGAGHLGCVAGRLAAEASFSVLFDPSVESVDKRRTSLRRVHSLFTSPLYDVRMESVKAFKKGLWSRVDRVVSDAVSSEEARSRTDVLSDLSGVVLWSLLVEMRRDDGIGPHRPTLRRLSRCAIECLSAVWRLAGNRPVQFATADMTADTMWDAFFAMWKLGGGRVGSVDDAKGNTDDEGKAGNSLSGNALELMSFLISVCLNDGNLGDTKSLDRVNSFVDAIEQALDPFSPWNVRHSAAVATATSGLLRLDGSGGNGVPAIQKRRFDLFMVALKFLEDNDSDVRRAVGRALVEINDPSRTPSTTTTGGQMTISLSSVSLASLEAAGDALRALTYGENGPGPEFLPSRLFSIVLRECQGVQEEVRCALEEFGFSRGTSDPDDLLNVNASRKIFEDEEPNPFEEKLVTCQLAVSILVNAAADVKHDDMLGNIVENLHAHSLNVVESILHTAKQGIIYDVSWVNRVFPCMHGILLSSIAAIYLGYPDTNGLVSKARSFREDADDGVLPLCSVHPCLVEALLVLSESAHGRGETRDGLLKCCFLLPKARHQSI